MRIHQVPSEDDGQLPQVAQASGFVLLGTMQGAEPRANRLPCSTVGAEVWFRTPPNLKRKNHYPLSANDVIIKRSQTPGDASTAGGRGRRDDLALRYPAPCEQTKGRTDAIGLETTSWIVIFALSST